jgi:hypothetical protein
MHGRNTFRHEHIYVSDERDSEKYKEYERKKLRGEVTGEFDGRLNNIEHAEDVYKVQMIYEEFKKAPIDYQKSRLTTYACFIIDGCKKRGMKRAEDIQKRYFDTFNGSVGKKIDASIMRDKTNPQYFIIVLRGCAPCYVPLDGGKDRK